MEKSTEELRKKIQNMKQKKSSVASKKPPLRPSLTSSSVVKPKVSPTRRNTEPINTKSIKSSEEKSRLRHSSEESVDKQSEFYTHKRLLITKKYIFRY